MVDPTRSDNIPEIDYIEMNTNNVCVERYFPSMSTNPAFTRLSNPEKFVRGSIPFDGDSGYEVHIFVYKVRLDKDFYKIDDETALSLFPKLLSGEAYKWWKVSKRTISSWDMALDLIQKTFGPRLPSYQIYREIFRREQGEESVEDFVFRIRSYMDQLPHNSLSQQSQLDIVYGLLHMRIKQKIPRYAVDSFHKLLKMAAKVEKAIERHRPRLLLEQRIPGDRAKPCYNCIKKLRDKCLTCNNDEPFYCANSVMRINARGDEIDCSNPHDYENLCVGAEQFGGPIEEVCSTKEGGCPMIQVEILEGMMTSVVDTAARYCVTGSVLYSRLQRLNHSFDESVTRVKLADGITREMTMFVTDLEVTLLHKTIKLPFVVMRDAVDSDLLLGINFLKAMNMVLDISTSCWYFAEDPKTQYPFQHTMSVLRIAFGDKKNTLKNTEGANLSAPERAQLGNLLITYGDIFYVSGGENPEFYHSIDTGNNDPVYVPPFTVQYTPSNCELIQKSVEKMLDSGLVEECKSPWNAPVLLFPKLNKSLTFCVDYRRLNQLTKLETCPMPLLQDLMKFDTKDCVISTLGFVSGYWQIGIRPEDQDKTAFQTHKGTYRFKKMPHGLKNAPATFQRFIQFFRSQPDLEGITILAYLDDIIVISENFESHVKHLELVFKRLRALRMGVKRKKCIFARESVTYVKQIISRRGVMPYISSVQKVLDMKEPTNQMQLRLFLYVCSFYRKIFPCLTKILKPLIVFIGKKQTRTWKMEQSQAFRRARQLLTLDQSLSRVCFGLPFIIRVDPNSYFVIYVVLLQEIQGYEIPIEFGSRLLTPEERSYSYPEREALGVLYALEQFRYYLNDSTVIVRSEFNNLLSIQAYTGRAVKWGLNVQQFDIKYEYIRADDLDPFRPPIYEKDEGNVCGICLIVTNWLICNPEKIRQVQLQDEDLKEIIVDLEVKGSTQSKIWSERRFTVQQGVLYRLNPDPYKDSLQVVVPRQVRDEIMEEWRAVHSSCHVSESEPVYVNMPPLDVIGRHKHESDFKKFGDYLKACVSMKTEVSEEGIYEEIQEKKEDEKKEEKKVEVKEKDKEDTKEDEKEEQEEQVKEQGKAEIKKENEPKETAKKEDEQKEAKKKDNKPKEAAKKEDKQKEAKKKKSEL